MDGLEAERGALLLARTTEVLCARIGYSEVDAEERRAFLHALAQAAHLT